jgi:hypothetical protein
VEVLRIDLPPVKFIDISTRHPSVVKIGLVWRLTAS